MVDRADPLSRINPMDASRPASKAARSSSRPLVVFLAIGCLELLWLGWFLVVPLPNVQVQKVIVRRGLLLLKAFPEVVPDTTFQQSLLGKGLSELSHVENLSQRLPIVLAAALIAAAAIGLGDLAGGLLGFRDRLRWPVRIALDYGLGAAMLGVLTLAIGRMGWLNPWSVRIGLGMLAGVGILGSGAWRFGRARKDHEAASPAPAEKATSGSGANREAWFFGLLIAPFVAITILGSMLPATDFDVIEYHLQGPKEYFQSGRIDYLPHNIYTNMPFDVEMLHLLGMEVMADWWWGALAGQLLVALFGPAAAVLIHATAARDSTRAGWIAALVYLSTPWVYRMGVIAYVEGPLCFYHAALVWAWSAVSADRGRTIDTRNVLIGLLAGAAMGCKYTALISAVIPFGLLAVVDCRRHHSLRPLLAFGLGWALIMGPWLSKNVIDTGDPVYPLGISRLPRTRLGRRHAVEVAQCPRAERHHLARARRLDRGRGRTVGLAIAALRRTGAAGAARLQPPFRDEAVGICRVPLRHLVAAHASSRPILAAHLAGPGGPGGFRGRLDQATRSGPSCWA